MINANDAFSVDWTNPTTHMLAGRDLGIQEAQDEIAAKDKEIERLQDEVVELNRLDDASDLPSFTASLTAADALAKKLEENLLFSDHRRDGWRCSVCEGLIEPFSDQKFSDQTATGHTNTCEFSAYTATRKGDTDES